MKSLDDLTEEILRELYLEQHLTETEIAEQYGCSQNAIWNRRKKWGIPKVGKAGRITAALEPLTSRQEALLYGSLLGDGGLLAQVCPELVPSVRRHGKHRVHDDGPLPGVLRCF